MSIRTVCAFRHPMPSGRPRIQTGFEIHLKSTDLSYATGLNARGKYGLPTGPCDSRRRRASPFRAEKKDSQVICLQHLTVLFSRVKSFFLFPSFLPGEKKRQKDGLCSPFPSSRSVTAFFRILRKRMPSRRHEGRGLHPGKDGLTLLPEGLRSAWLTSVFQVGSMPAHGSAAQDAHVQCTQEENMDYSLYTRTQLLQIIEVMQRPRTSDPKYVYEKVLAPYCTEHQEHFIVITLDASMKMIGSHVITKGLVNRTLVHPREVFRPAFLDNAVAIALAHNHPSGDLSASPDDLECTSRLKKAGEILGIMVVDHIIFGFGNYRSMAESGELF